MKTQAWGWLMAGVVAAGMNAWYHDGGFRLAHRVVQRIEHGTAATLALAQGRADEFLMQAQMMTAANEPTRCPLAAQLARVEAVSDRERARLDRFEASRVRMEARMEAQAARMQVAMVEINPVVSSCPRVMVRVPRAPRVLAFSGQ